VKGFQGQSEPDPRISRGVGALEGLRIIDMGQIWAGPLCANLLGDMGAEVVRVETRGRAAMSGRPEFGGEDVLENAASYYLRNRLCLSADLSYLEGRDLVRDLIGISDVLIENFSPRALPSWGLDYKNLYKINPSIILLSLSAAGQTGPWSQRITQGPTLSALYGRASLIGYPGEEWPRADTAEGDPLAASFGVIALMAALFHRDRTGEGQHIDLAQGEAMLALDAEAVLDYTMNGRVKGFQGNHSATMSPHGIYPCKGDDQWIAISVESDDQWEKFCQLIVSSPWLKDDRLKVVEGRILAADELDMTISEWTNSYDPWSLTRMMQLSGIPAYPVLNARGQLDDPHLRYRRSYLIQQETSLDLDELTFTNPWKLNATPPSIRRVTPSIGEDNELILYDMLGRTSQEVALLEELGVLV
jgi:crotonobetainyl-CoA:carnitine CoA-transferase CaiB-like acyl-CoA transferase